MKYTSAALSCANHQPEKIMARIDPPVPARDERHCPKCPPVAPLTEGEKQFLMARMLELVNYYGYTILLTDTLSDILYMMAHDPNHPETRLLLLRLMQPNG